MSYLLNWLTSLETKERKKLLSSMHNVRVHLSNNHAKELWFPISDLLHYLEIDIADLTEKERIIKAVIEA